MRRLTLRIDLRGAGVYIAYQFVVLPCFWVVAWLRCGYGVVMVWLWCDYGAAMVWFGGGCGAFVDLSC